VYDVDDPRGSLVGADHIGYVETTLAEIITNRAGLYTAELKDPAHPGKRGTIRVVAEEIREANDEVAFTIEGHNLDKKDLFGKSDPYLVIQQMREGANVPVHKTEVIMSTLNPRWRPFTVTSQKLCNGDLDRPLLVECWDWDRRGSHDFIGSAQTSLRQLTATPVCTLVLIPKKVTAKKPNAGTLSVQVAVVKVSSFVDYLRGGCELSLMVAIDFTASNGAPTMPSSLHYMNPVAPNAYVQAISTVGSILAPYDHDGSFPCFGFGAKMPDGTVSHCFALNGNPANPEVAGVPGIIEAYNRALASVQLYGPTLFAQVLKTTAEIAALNSQDPTRQKYFVLLMITDGAINDMGATVEQLVHAANNLPLSVVIVGVGNDDFKAMEELDGDNKALSCPSGVATRDIVQFVPFNR
jgi:hypothetical protein